MSVKQERLDMILHREISNILQFDLKDPKLGFVTVTDVHCTKDLSVAKVYVTFLGKIKRKNISEFWQKMDIGINMSDYEGRSISMLEMMANGTVPVLTNVSGVREDIINNINGYIIPLGDVNTAVNKIEYLYNHRNKLVEMGEKAHYDMTEKSDREKHYNFWMQIFDELGYHKNEAAI